MKTFLKIGAVLVILVLLFFLPLFQIATTPLPSDIIFYYGRVGGVAGFFDKISITDTGEIRSEELIKNPNDTKAKNLSDERLRALEDYISNNRYAPVKISLFDKIYTKKEKVYPDMMSIVVKIRNSSKTIEIHEDDFTRSLLNDIGI